MNTAKIAETLEILRDIVCDWNDCLIVKKGLDILQDVTLSNIEKIKLLRELLASAEPTT